MAQDRPDSVSSQKNKALSRLDSPDDKQIDVSDEPEYVPITPSDLAEKSREIRSNLRDMHRHKSKVVTLLESEPIPSVPSGLENRLTSLRISFALATVVNHIADRQFQRAEKQARMALHLAKASGDKLLKARCRYWMGRIEFEQQNMASAHDHFLAARACLMDNVNPEGETLRFYLNASKVGMSEEYRRRIISQHDRSLLQRAPREKASTPSVPSQRKRKRVPQPWTIVARQASAKQNEERQKRRTGTITSNPSPRKKNQRTVRDMADLPLRLKDDLGANQRNKTVLNNHHHDGFTSKEQSTESSTMESAADLGVPAHKLEGMEWLQSTHSRPRLEQRGEFTLRCYPVGLAPRTRSTEIFSKLPDEVLLSTQEWKALREMMSNRGITMSFLAKEKELQRGRHLQSQ